MVRQVWSSGYDPNDPESNIRAGGSIASFPATSSPNSSSTPWTLPPGSSTPPPSRPTARAAKKAASTPVTCNDHFGVIFSFPKEVLVNFTGTQFGTGYSDIGCRMFGPQGTIDTHYFGIVQIVGHKSYQGGKLKNLYADGAISNIAAFHTAIGKGDYSNATVPPSVRSNLTTILGRTAAYKKAEVTWDEMIRAGEKLDYSMAGLKS